MTTGLNNSLTALTNAIADALAKEWIAKQATPDDRSGLLKYLNPVHWGAIITGDTLLGDEDELETHNLTLINMSLDVADWLETISDIVGATYETSATVACLLKRSTDALDLNARRCFALLGLFVPKPATFDLEAMAVAWDAADARPMARVLVNRGLLEPISGGRFQMHAVLILHARTLLEQENIL